jgi:hypothetical protein
VEWHPGELYPRVGFIVTNMARPAENIVAFYNKRGTCEQWIKEGKGAIKWTRLSCRTFAANAVRLQLHALAYNLGNFLRTLATPEPIKDWLMTSLKEKLIKIGAKVVSHGRYVAFQMAEVATHGICSPTFCGSSRNCGRRHHQRPREKSEGHASNGTDGRSASECQGKRSDQTLEHRLGGLECRPPAVPRILGANQFRKRLSFTSVRGSSGESRL